jgi:hypothetical protein
MPAATSKRVSAYSARIAKELSEIETGLDRLLEGLGEREFATPPAPGLWSASQCIEHLDLTGRALLPLWGAAISDGWSRAMFGDGPFRYNPLLRLWLRATEPPYRMKGRTTAPFYPADPRPMREVVESFLAMHRETLRYVESSVGLDLARVKVPSPFISRLQYPLGFSFEMLAAHERRHLWQAEQARKALGF